VKLNVLENVHDAIRIKKIQKQQALLAIQKQYHTLQNIEQLTLKQQHICFKRHLA